MEGKKKSTTLKELSRTGMPEEQGRKNLIGRKKIGKKD